MEVIIINSYKKFIFSHKLKMGDYAHSVKE